VEHRAATIFNQRTLIMVSRKRLLANQYLRLLSAVGENPLDEREDAARSSQKRSDSAQPGCSPDSVRT
jgi:hypothetical protein